MPSVPNRLRRLLGAAFLGVVLILLYVPLGNRSLKGSKCCHPNLSRLRDAHGREVVLIGTLALDIDGVSGGIVRGALNTLRPEIIMVEGSVVTGVNAMISAGRWEVAGSPPIGNEVSNWSDISDAAPVNLVVPKQAGWRSLFAGRVRWPETSLVPVKVHNWSLWLRGAVGGDVAASLTYAAANSVPMRFLGPEDGGTKGHVQVTFLAQQTVSQLLLQERQRGTSLSSDEMDSALAQAERTVREDSANWLQDPRAASTQLQEQIQAQLSKDLQALKVINQKMEERIQSMTSNIQDSMNPFQLGAVVLNVEQLADVEDRLMRAGFSYVSECA